MIAAILTKLNSPLAVANICEPHDLAYGQVRVCVLASGICGAQLREIAGHVGNAAFLPHMLGHEGSGIVEAIGAGVARVKVGDKVVMHWRKAAGIEAAFPSYEWWQSPPKPCTKVGGGKVTTLTEVAIVSENRVTPVPSDTPDDLCALLGCGLSTALGTIERDAAVRFGESVMIVGAGGLGANLIRCAKLARAHPIVAVDVHDDKEKGVLALGATRYINGYKTNPDGKYDVIIDTSGSVAGIETSLPLLNPSGRFIMVGQPKPGCAVRMLDAKHMFDGEGKTIKATQGGGFRPDIDIPRYLAMAKSGALDITGIVTHRMPLARVNEALDKVRSGAASRIIIDMSL